MPYTCYTNPMIPQGARLTSSTNHHHGAIRPNSTPETDLICTLNPTTALRLFETHSFFKAPSVRHIATSSASIHVWFNLPALYTRESTITGDFRAECLSTQTVARGPQQCGMLGVVGARDLKFVSADQPECWLE